MANDLFIEFRRKKYIQMNFTRDELHRINFEKRMDDLKNDLKEALDDKSTPTDQKLKLRNINMKELEETLRKVKEP